MAQTEKLFGQIKVMDMQQPSQFPTLVTERLVLRKLEIKDAPEIFELRSDEQVNQYVARARSTTVAEAAAFINKIIATVENNQSYYWALEPKNGGKLIGTICLWNVDAANSTIEIGYELLPNWQGKGLAREALLAVIEFTFKTLKFETIAAYSHAHNQQSIRLLERNGFTRDKLLEEVFYEKEGPQIEIVYSIKNPVPF